MKSIIKKAVCINLAAVLLAGVVLAAPISEPSTVFYGKVTGTGGAQPFLVADGVLEWTILKADGSEMVLRTELYPLANAQYSYRLDVPHSASAYELEDEGIPLPPIAETNVHVSASVDGLAAVFTGPSGATFAAGQATRAATYRLDLEIALAPLDSDGDGIPDWWEDEYGFDLQRVADAADDADGDGLSNLQEYLRGLNPLLDSRIPEIATETLLAYAGCTTGVRLKTDDIDSAFEDLIYTLVSAPTKGTLVHRNQVSIPEAPDLPLTAGAEFSQQDVTDGKVVFVHDGGSVSNDLFVLSVRDEDGSHAASTGTLAVSFFEPAETVPSSLKEMRRQRAYAVGLLQDAVVWDGQDDYGPVAVSAPSSELTDQEYAAAYVPAFGNEVGQMMTGGRNDDELSGGMANDMLVGGTGADVLSGGGGADRFVFDESDLGVDTITDFSPEEGDVIDLSGVLGGAFGLVDDYLRFDSDGTNTLMGLNLDGNGGAFTDLVVSLQNVQVDSQEAYDLVLNSDVLAGSLWLLPRISVAVSDAEASENGNNSGTFILSRVGDLSAELDVTVSLGGSAVNGTDYSALDTAVVFAAGVDQVTLTVSPFADSTVEPAETVELLLQPGNGYCLHSADRASLTIKDLQAVVGVELLEGLASKDPLAPATVLVTRNGQTANSLLVRLSIGGSAQNGTDYRRVPAYVNFSPGQTTVPIDLLPLADGELAGGAETVQISISENAEYVLADVHSARVILADRRDSLADWQAREFPGSTETPEEFAAGDSGNTGVDHLQRYAFGMNPLNPEDSRRPQLVFRDGRCCLDVFKNQGAVDIEYIVEVSTDLENWDSSDSAVEEITASEYELAADVETYQAVAPVLVTPRLYMRVRLVYQP
ncbi:MAG: type I secretion C-terminal target domain-containing protein [Kiritimatiellales bacterium]|nr:type I secretion C-terminal target domain-containing protein [Kiritimatiellales bacterium]